MVTRFPGKRWTLGRLAKLAERIQARKICRKLAPPCQSRFSVFCLSFSAALRSTKTCTSNADFHLILVKNKKKEAYFCRIARFCLSTRLSLLHEPLFRGCGHTDILTEQPTRLALIDMNMDQSIRFQWYQSNPTREWGCLWEFRKAVIKWQLVVDYLTGSQPWSWNSPMNCTF